MKVMNGLVMTLEEDRRFLCVWQLYYVSNFAVSRMKVPRSIKSSREVLDKITSIRSKLPTAACLFRERKRGNCEANLQGHPTSKLSEKSSGLLVMFRDCLQSCFNQLEKFDPFGFLS